MLRTHRDGRSRTPVYARGRRALRGLQTCSWRLLARRGEPFRTSELLGPGLKDNAEDESAIRVVCLARLWLIASQLPR